VVVQVKALACELPWRSGVPLSRFSSSEIAREAMQRGIAADISGSTVWRWLHEDAIRPWQYRSWIFPQDPDFERKAGVVLDLYHSVWGSKHLGKRTYVICADEKPGIQARVRLHDTEPPRPGQCARVEHHYERGGTLAYLAAWDVHRAKLFGRCEPRGGIESFDRLVSQVMGQEPYCSARRVFWIMDNGSAHRGAPCVRRLRKAHRTLVAVHLPVHASWLNQIEIYFSIVQRKVLTPNDFASLEDVTPRLLGFERRYEQIAEPFEWKFTRQDLAELLEKLGTDDAPLRRAA
jgi:transposase